MVEGAEAADDVGVQSDNDEDKDEAGELMAGWFSAASVCFSIDRFFLRFSGLIWFNLYHLFIVFVFNINLQTEWSSQSM